MLPYALSRASGEHRDPIDAAALTDSWELRRHGRFLGMPAFRIVGRLEIAVCSVSLL